MSLDPAAGRREAGCEPHWAAQTGAALSGNTPPQFQISAPQQVCSKTDSSAAAGRFPSQREECLSCLSLSINSTRDATKSIRTNGKSW